jgi:hypothetical protein
LHVKVEQPAGHNVLRAIVEGLPLLQDLQIRFNIHSNATALELHELRSLPHLCVLEFSGLFERATGQSLSNAQ